MVPAGRETWLLPGKANISYLIIKASVQQSVKSPRAVVFYISTHAMSCRIKSLDRD